MALIGIIVVFAKESYLGVGQFKIYFHNGPECSTIEYLDFELAPRGVYQTEAAFGSSRGTQY